MVRAAAVLALLTATAVYSALAPKLPRLSDWADVALLSLVVLTATFALVWLALPLRARARRLDLGVAAVVLAALAATLHLAELDIAANFAKLAAATAAGWWFLTFFESAAWVLLVAVLIVPVDLFSVARGPTREITENQPHVFDALSIFLRIPGEEPSAQLGLPDILFFALFLGTTVRFSLRTRLTWLAMTLSFGATLALAVGFRQAGVAALPLLSLAFVLVNADLVWAAWRRKPA